MWGDYEPAANVSLAKKCVWAHEHIFFTIYRQKETTRRIARKFITNVVEQISNRQLVRTVLEGKNEKSSKRRSAALNEIQHRHAMCLVWALAPSLGNRAFLPFPKPAFNPDSTVQLWSRFMNSLIKDILLS